MTAVTRRMGPKGSEIWHSMLDAAEDILRNQGYGELTSRQIAERLGVKQRLVYYYFTSMDELIVETFRRLALREIERFEQAASSNQSAREIWNICVDNTDTKLISEFMALANRIDALRMEVSAHIETTRAFQIAAIERALGRSRHRASIPPPAAALLATAAALAMRREAAIGVTTGHAEVLDVIAGFIAKLDPPGAP